MKLWSDALFNAPVNKNPLSPCTKDLYFSKLASGPWETENSRPFNTVVDWSDCICRPRSTYRFLKEKYANGSSGRHVMLQCSALSQVWTTSHKAMIRSVGAVGSRSAACGLLQHLLELLCQRRGGGRWSRGSPQTLEKAARPMPRQMRGAPQQQAGTKKKPRS